MLGNLTMADDGEIVKSKHQHHIEVFNINSWLNGKKKYLKCIGKVWLLY